MKVSISAFKQWRDCRRRWFFAHKMRLEPQSPQPALMLGSGIHAALGKYYREGSGLLDRMFYDWAEIEIFKLRNQLGPSWVLYGPEVEALVELGTGMLAHYQEWCLSQDDFTVVDTEINFEVPVNNLIVLKGRIDGIVRDGNGLLWVLEHKTQGSLTNTAWTGYDAQCTAYVWAASQLADSPVQGMLYNFLRKEVPQPPRTLKNGQLSKDTRQLTTYELYKRTIIMERHNPEHYLDILAHLKEQPNPFFKRVWETRSPVQVSRWLRVFSEVCREMQEAPIYQNDGISCGWCPFEAPCHALELGADIDIALQGFQPRDTEDEFLPASQVDWSSI